MQNHYAAARQAFTQALELVPGPGRPAAAGRGLAPPGPGRGQGETATAWAQLRESEALFRALGKEEGVAWVLTTMAELAVVEDAATAAALWRRVRRARPPAAISCARPGTSTTWGMSPSCARTWAAAARCQEHSLAVFAALFGARTYGATWAWEELG